MRQGRTCRCRQGILRQLQVTPLQRQCNFNYSHLSRSGELLAVCTRIAAQVHLTLNGRIRIRSASAPFLPPITTAEGWQDGQIPVVAMAFIIAWQDPVAIYGSAYNRSL